MEHELRFAKWKGREIQNCEILENRGLTFLVFFYFWLFSVFFFLIFSPISPMPKAVSEVPCGVIFTLISNLIPCNRVELRAVAQSCGHQCRKLEQERLF